MTEVRSDDLFDLKLNAYGITYIRKFAVWARLFILIGVVISLVHITSTIAHYFIFDAASYVGFDYLIWEHKLLPYYTVCYCLLFYPQMHLYWQVTRFFKKGLNYNDEKSFNEAFRVLFRSTAFGLASFLLSLISYGFELFVLFKYYVK